MKKILLTLALLFFLSANATERLHVSAMDDFSGNYLIGPIHQEHQTKITGGPVILKKFSQVGAHCVVFPNLTIEEGAIVGAMSLVNKTVNSWTIVAGIPIRFIKGRNKGLLELIC